MSCGRIRALFALKEFPNYVARLQILGQFAVICSRERQAVRDLRVHEPSPRLPAGRWRYFSLSRS